MIEDTCPALSTFLNEGKFGGDNKCVEEYAEDDWTYRLYCCLQIEKIDAEYTAQLRGCHTNKSLKRRIPDVVGSNSLLFRGSPDLIIKAKKENNDEGIVVVETFDNVGSGDNMGDDHDVPLDGDSSPSSQDSGKTQPYGPPYHPKSVLTEKVGELVAALHTSLACRALRRYVRRKKVSSLTAHGLHIHRSLSVIHLEVTINDMNPLKVKATQLVGGFLSADMLCPIIKLFMDKLSSRS